MRKFLSNRSGATAIEYSLIAVVMCVALITGGAMLSTKTQDNFEAVAQAFN